MNTKPCHSPYCECDQGKCTHPGFHDARHEPVAFMKAEFDSMEAAVAALAVEGKPHESAVVNQLLNWMRGAPQRPADADWTQPTTHSQRIADVMQLLCGGKRPGDDIVAAWLADSDDTRLQEFAIEHGPAWAQGIAVIDAARVLADQPTEGVAHEFVERPADAEPVGLTDEQIDAATDPEYAGQAGEWSGYAQVVTRAEMRRLVRHFAAQARPDAEDAAINAGM